MTSAFGFEGHVVGSTYDVRGSVTGVFGVSGHAAGCSFTVAFSGSRVFGFTGSVRGDVRSIAAPGSAGGAFGFSGHVRGYIGHELPATVWEWVTPEVDPYILATSRVHVATQDGVYTVIDPAEITALNLEENDRGGVESISMTLKRDARLQLGELDYLAVCRLDYLGKRWFGRLEEQGIELSSSMSRPLRFSGFVGQLADHKAYRRLFISEELDEWQTDQGPQPQGAAVVEVSAS